MAVNTQFNIRNKGTFHFLTGSERKHLCVVNFTITALPGTRLTANPGGIDMFRPFLKEKRIKRALSDSLINCIN